MALPVGLPLENLESIEVPPYEISTLADTYYGLQNRLAQRLRSGLLIGSIVIPESDPPAIHFGYALTDKAIHSTLIEHVFGPNQRDFVLSPVRGMPETQLGVSFGQEIAKRGIDNYMEVLVVGDVEDSTSLAIARTAIVQTGLLMADRYGAVDSIEVSLSFNEHDTERRRLTPDQLTYLAAQSSAC